MKTSKRLILLFSFFTLALSCKHESICETGDGMVITFGNGDQLHLPECWQHNKLQGIDTEVGEITYPQKGIVISYDIGALAGNYVQENSPDKTIDQSVNEEFWYEAVDSQNLGDEDCCVYVTFPNAGPANFVLPNDENLDEILEGLRTYTSA